MNENMSPTVDIVGMSFPLFQVFLDWFDGSVRATLKQRLYSSWLWIKVQHLKQKLRRIVWKELQPYKHTCIPPITTHTYISHIGLTRLVDWNNDEWTNTRQLQDIFK